MNAHVPVLIAIGSGADEPRNISDVWLPAFAQAGLRPESLYEVAGDESARANAGRLADALGVDLTERDATKAAAVLTTARGPAQAAAVALAADLALPVLLDSPAGDATDDLAALIDKAPAARLVSGYHLCQHPGFTRTVTAVRNAEIGLLRAVALDVVTSGQHDGEGAGPAPTRVLRDLGGHATALLRAVTGPSTVRLQAHHTSSGSWTLLGQADRDVVVSAHFSQVPGSTGVVHARLRVVGTHGTAMVDLTRPALEVRTTPGTTMTVPYGTSSVVATLCRLGAVARGEANPDRPEDLISLARALDAIGESAAMTHTTTLTW